MGYRIEYDRGNAKYEITETASWRFPLILTGIVVLFLVFICVFSPESAAGLRAVLIPGEDAVTVQAFQIMTNDLRSGASVYAAVEAFCRFVIHGK